MKRTLGTAILVGAALVLAVALAGCVRKPVSVGPANPAVAGASDHQRGKQDASVRVVEYGDFQCPACAAAYPGVKALSEEYGDRVTFVYRHFPLRQHQFAKKAAEAVEAAGAQGKFWEMHDKLYENQQNLTESDLTRYAEELGLDIARFNQELTGSTYAALVEQNLAAGLDAGVGATPTFFVGEQRIEGADITALKAAIDAALTEPTS
jgi:protein-disulfide isomerase